MEKKLLLQKYAFIDALRGWAILGVIFVHASHWFPPSSVWLHDIASQGARGVQLFFLASALTLFISLDSRRSTEFRPNLNFFIRRFFRIAPLFYLGIVFYFIYFGTEAHFWRPNGFEWWHIAATAGFIHGLHPETFNSIVPGGWSIGVEFIFYLFVPLLFVAIKSLKQALLATIFVLFGSVAFCRLIEYGVKTLYPETQYYLVESFIFMSFISQLPIFAFGIVNYYLIKKFPQDASLKVISKLASIVLVTLLFAIVLYLNGVVAIHIVFGPMFLGFSLLLYFRPLKVFVNFIVRTVGTLSFSMYLTHFVVLYLMKVVFPEGFGLTENIDFFIAFVLITIATAGLSFGTYNLVERPGVRLGKKLVAKLELRQAKRSAEAILVR